MRIRDTIETLPISELREYAGNAKKHPDSQVDAIAKSIQEFGFNVPIFIDENNEIIAGHGRVLAAKKLGMTEVPCVRAKDLSDAKKRAYRLFDNKSNTMSDFDLPAVIHELASINADGLDISLTGFDPKLLDMPVEPDKSGKVRMDVTQLVKCPNCGHEHEIKR